MSKGAAKAFSGGSLKYFVYKLSPSQGGPLRPFNMEKKWDRY